MNLQERVDSYQNDRVIAQYARENRASLEEARVCFAETKQFLLRSAIVGKPLRPTPRVDRMWHTFILFTRDYAHFNRQVLGGDTFIHHVPDEPGPDMPEPHPEERVLDRLLRPLEFIGLRPRMAMASTCTSDQDGSQDNGGGNDDGYIP